MKRNNFKLALLMSLAIFFSGFTAIYLYNNTNLLKDHVVEDLESFLEELKISFWNWTSTEVVSTESTGDSRYPTIAVDGSGNAHIAWCDDMNYGGSETDEDIFYKRWNATTETWTTTEVVSEVLAGESRDPTIAADGSGNVHIAWMDLTNYLSSGTDRDIFYRRWNATTAAWTTIEVVSTESTLASNSPTIATDGFGNVHIAWDDETDYGGSGPGIDIFYRCWNATTAAWATTEVVSTESTSHSYRPTIAADGTENVHIAWEESMDYLSSGTDWDIFYKRWNATTAAWTTTEVVSTESSSHSHFTTISVEGSGNAHIAWQDETDYSSSGTDFDIFYKRWNTTTAVWTTTEVVSTESTGNSYDPTISADGSGNVHIAWRDQDLFYKRWNATTAAWTTTEVVSELNIGGFLYPTISVDSSRNVHIAWADETDFGGSGTDWDIFYKKFTSSPLNPFIIINNGDASIDSTLVNLTLSADKAEEMCFRNGTAGTWTSWEAYNTTKDLYLEGSVYNTEYSIYVTFRNEIGETSPVGDSILYLIFTPPLNPSIIINSGDASTDSNLVTLTLSVDGAGEMCFRNGSIGAWTDWEPFAIAKQLYLEGSINNTEYSIYVKFRNEIGETSPVGDSIFYLTKPLNPSIIINNGDASTDSTLVNLTLSADGAGEMCFRNGTTGTWTNWEAYSATKQSYLEGSINNTEYSIYVKFRNAIGETSPVGDSILYLICIPLNPSIIINNGDASTNSTLVTLTLSAVGATEMCFRNVSIGTWTDWEPYATVKQLYLGSSINNSEIPISVKFRNKVGETLPVYDSIRYLITAEEVEEEEEEEEETLPFIPGYPDEWLIISLLAGIGVIAILNKSKRIKLRN